MNPVGATVSRGLNHRHRISLSASSRQLSRPSLRSVTTGTAASRVASSRHWSRSLASTQIPARARSISKLSMSSPPIPKAGPTSAVDATPAVARPDRAEENTFTLPSGRTLGYAIYGVSPSASPYPPVFYLHGYPSCRLDASFKSKELYDAKISMIALDRPGFGLSTAPLIPLSSRTVLDHAADIEALADHLQLPRFAVLGVSGGGPYAWASAHSIAPSRLAGVGVICGMGPYALVMTPEVWKELWWLNKIGFTLPMRITWLYRQLYRLVLPIAARVVEGLTYDKVANDKKANPVDLAAVRALGEESWNECKRPLAETLRQPKWHRWHVDEARLLAKDWPFALEDVPAGKAGEEGKVPVKLWYGEDDTSTPAVLGRKIKDQVPAADLVVVQGGTHTSVILGRLVSACKELLGIQ